MSIHTVKDCEPQVGTVCKVWGSSEQDPFMAVWENSLFEFETFRWDLKNGCNRSTMTWDRWTEVKEPIPMTEMIPLLCQVCTVFSNLQGEFDAELVRNEDKGYVWQSTCGGSNRPFSYSDKWILKTAAPRSVSHGDFCEAIDKEPEPEWPTNKYDRPLFGVKNAKTIDVYAVLEMFGVTCPARQHGIKKLLCAGIRGKGNAIQDLTEAQEAITHAIRLQKEREQCG
jgi:hypothetical protein